MLMQGVLNYASKSFHARFQELGNNRDADLAAVAAVLHRRKEGNFDEVRDLNIFMQGERVFSWKKRPAPPCTPLTQKNFQAEGALRLFVRSRIIWWQIILR